MNIWIINGPNLNLLGVRNHNIYGPKTLSDIIDEITATYDSDQIHIHHFQSNHEGVLIDKIQEIGFLEKTAAIINPGGLTHTSVSLRDTIDAVTTPFVEVHISDIHNRESFRHHSYISDVAIHSIIGKGTDGYAMAVDYLLAM